jgi:hypothetical protein
MTGLKDRWSEIIPYIAIRTKEIIIVLKTLIISSEL